MVNFNKKIQENLEKLCTTGKLFRSSMTGQQIWDLYLSGFTPENNPIFRDPNSTTHNCNLCNNFMRRYGNIIAIDDDLNVITLFDGEFPTEYSNSAKAVSLALKKAKIENVFFETFSELNSLPYEKCNKENLTFKLGIDKNVKRYTKEESERYGVVKPNEVRTFNHMHMFLPKQFVDMGNKSIESIQAGYRDDKNVFQRAMQEISIDTLNLVKDLINQGSLLDGTTHLYKIESIIPKKLTYDELSNKEKDNWCWVNSYNYQFAKFKNELIGVLCTELSEGEELNKACQAWNKRVDPANYMKAVAPITKKQIEEAKKFVEENGYEASFNRRHAIIDDIKSSEILHINVGKGDIKTISIFDAVKSTATRHKRAEFDGIEEVTIEKFMKDILPGCTSVEAFLMNSHESNLVSLTTSVDKESKPIFKWSNNYSKTFNGNLAGKSMIKEAVKSRGGKTEGVLNIRLAFPGTTDDYDLHLLEPDKTHIYFSNVRVRHKSSGMLDLDAQGVDGHQVPEKRVENIIYTDLSSMPEGTYQVYINNYSQRGFHTNFLLEVETGGEVIVLELDPLLSKKNTVNVLKIELRNGQFTFYPDPDVKLVSSNSISKEIYGLETNQFHKVNLVCLSPNHWGDNNVGNKYYLFMLEGCKCSTDIRGFHNEDLLPELLPHRKVLDVLANTTMIKPSDKQLSGLGFNSTVKDELVVRLQGSHKRIIKIQF